MLVRRKQIESYDRGGRFGLFTTIRTVPLTSSTRVEIRLPKCSGTLRPYSSAKCHRAGESDKELPYMPAIPELSWRARKLYGHQQLSVALTPSLRESMLLVSTSRPALTEVPAVSLRA